MNSNLKSQNSSPSFCILPWIHINVMPNGSVIPCCISPYDNVYGDGQTQNLEEIWNSDKFKELRLKMLSGELVNGCSRCYKLEKSGFRSMREEMNEFFHDEIESSSKTNSDGSVDEVKLSYIDIRFSNLCNFKCRGCGPTLSSAWHEDHQLLFDYQSISPKVNSISVNSPNFWNELKSLIPKSKVIYFGGGEPLITKEHYEVLNILKSNSLFDIELRYNTNLSQLNYGNYNLSEMWSYFKKVSLSISIDDIGKRAEYFRHGTNWNTIEQNIKILMEKYPQIDRYVNCTVNIMNVYYLPEIYDYLTSRNLIEPSHFRVNLLLDPDELRIDVLPKKLKERVKTRLLKFKFKLSCLDKKFHYSISEIESVIDFMEKEDRSHLLLEFKKNTEKLDQIRNESFSVAFPELTDLLQP